MGRDSNSAFFADYLCFDASSVEGSDLKSLTILGASAVSLLAYQNTDATQAEQEFLKDKFSLVRDSRIISSIWNYDVSPNAGDSVKRALLAWSTRLQTIFVGFAGTHNKEDVLKDVDMRFKASPDLASRFHHGFHSESMSYRGLVQELSKKHRVVLCGHSLGGAVAAILTYEILATAHSSHPCSNSWEGPHGLSAISFGAPPAMVPEDEETTAAFMKSTGKNIHNVINASDSIPFVVNTTVEKITSFLEHGLGIFQKSLASSAMTLASEMVVHTLRFLRGGQGRFVHFGCIYVLETGRDESMQCRSVNSPGCIPSNPENTAQSMTSMTRIHSMEHYYNCVSRVLKQSPSDWSKLVLGSRTSPLMDPDAFIQDCLRLPSDFQDFEGHIHDDKVVIAGTLHSTLARYLISFASFKLEAQNERMTSLCFSHTAISNQVSMNMEYHIGDTKETVFFLEVADAIQRDLRIHDVFGRHIKVPIRKMQHTSAVDISLPPTFESVRHSMLIALVEQTAKAQKLRRGDDSGLEDQSSLAAALTDKASHIANLIDRFVAFACPHIFVSNLKKSCWYLRDLWDPTIQDKKMDEEHARLMDELHSQTPESQVPGNFPTEDPRIPDYCPGDLKRRLSEILATLDDSCGNQYSKEVCSKQPHPTLQSTKAVSGSLFSTALSEYALVLYKRPDNDKERISRAVEQMGEVLNVMRLCHLVILTQLDADPDWFFDISDIKGDRILTSATFAAALGSLAYSPNLAGVFAFGGIAFWVRRYLNRPKAKHDLKYEDKLAISLEILEIPRQRFGVIMENSISELLKASHSRDSERTLPRERLQRLVQDRMQVHRELPEGLVPRIHGKKKVQPTSLWMDWLLMVAEIGDLRSTIAQKLRVGVIGPTEAGKSQLLSTLTGVPADVFRPGWSLAGRTMEVQAYEPPNCPAATFLDFPGCDDQDPRMREIGRLFRAILDVVIFVYPQGSLRSETRERFLKEVADFLSKDQEKRPVRVLLSKADQIPFNRHRPDNCTNAIKLNKEMTIDDIVEYGKLGPDFSVRCRQPVRSKRTSDWGSGIVMGTETLNEIVRPYSTYAQQRYMDGKALSDCQSSKEEEPRTSEEKEPRTKEEKEPRITEKAMFRHLYDLAEEGELLWDVESLRQWLRNILPQSVPDTTRVSSEGLSW